MKRCPLITDMWRHRFLQVWRKRVGGVPPPPSAQRGGRGQAQQPRVVQEQGQGSASAAGASADPMRELCRLYDVVRTGFCP